MLNSRWTPRQLELAVLLALGLALFIRYPSRFIASPPFLMDFEVYRAAAERVLHGRGEQLYDPTTSEKMMFKYAPLWAVFMAPLGALPKPAAAICWTSVELLALLAALLLCGLLCRRLGFHPHPLTGLLAVLMLLRPLAEELGNGQANLLWGALMVGFVVAEHAGRRWLAALALSAAILLKLPALLFLPYLVLRKRWPLAGRAALIILLAGAAGALLVAPHAPGSLFRGWLHALAYNTETYTFEIGNQSLVALLSRFLTNDGYGLNLLDAPRSWLVWLTLGLLGALVAALARPWPGAAREPMRWAFDGAILTVLMVIGSPSCWLATYTALLFPVFLALAALAHSAAVRRVDGGSLGVSLLGLCAILLTHRKAWRLLGLTSWRGESYLFLVFMMLPWFGLMLTALLWRQRRWLSRA
ncbi:MAG: DUF2029 domain-containing protein [Candidatus Omnitrophica bacterium]|nr:DUF2029 domain-containing protein [Candidatus Omnitrophota bacterium]